jgi:hypothetical protein
MKAYGGVDVWLHIFLTSVLAGGEWSASRPGRFTSAPGTHWIGGWVDPSAGMDGVEKRKYLTLLELELRPLVRPARSQSLYRLSYPGSCLTRSTYWYRCSFCETNNSLRPAWLSVIITEFETFVITYHECFEFCN